MTRSLFLSVFFSLCSLCLCGSSAFADAPVASYVFPAGGQRGTAVKVRVGGLCLYDKCAWELCGPGVAAGKHLSKTKTLWFEGPILPLPDSQRQENYPQDMAGEVVVAKEASLGIRRGRLWTSEGADSNLTFMVGELPEVVEQESSDPAPVEVKLPLTINGRIFPRENVDVWTFAAKKGQRYACEIHAARLGSLLDSRLEVRDSEGETVAENDDARGKDSFLQFTAARDGKYSVHVHDSQRLGSQAHVYRLTISDGPYVDHVYPLGARKGTKTRFTLSGANLPKDSVEATFDEVGMRTRPFSISGKTTNAVTLDVDELPEALETEPNDEPAKGAKVTLPHVVNGRIDKPGDVDCWRFDAKKGQTLEFTMRSLALGSPLAGVAEILDDAGKSLMRSPPRSSEFLFAVPRDGAYTLRLSEQFRKRGGPAFVYRLRLREAVPDFRLELVSSAATVLRGDNKAPPFRVKVIRTGGFNGPVAVTAAGLPDKVKLAPATANGGQAQVDLRFAADKDAAIGTSRVKITGTATINGKSVMRTATLQPGPEDVPVDDVLLAVGLKAPFEIVGEYDLRLAPRGTVFRKKFTIKRNGYEGPLEVRLADKQARHLQGVTGPTLTVPADVNEFVYPVSLPPWMETGRTSRACVMAVGKVKVDGTEHVVSFSSQQQNEQIIAVVETGQLGLELGKPSVAVKRNGTVDLPVSVRRGKGLAGAVKIEVILPEQTRGLSAEAVTVAADKTAATLKLKAGAEPPSLAVLVRATIETKDGQVIAETKAEVVAE